MTIRGSDHPITITPSGDRVTIHFGGRVIAETRRALLLQEASYPAVLYVPREDADMPVFHRSETTTHCPHKGDASYFSLRVGDAASEDAVWSYETPFEAVAQIAGHFAFYPDRVESIERRPA